MDKKSHQVHSGWAKAYKTTTTNMPTSEEKYLAVSVSGAGGGEPVGYRQYSLSGYGTITSQIETIPESDNRAE